MLNEYWRENNNIYCFSEEDTKIFNSNEKLTLLDYTTLSQLLFPIDDLVYYKKNYLDDCFQIQFWGLIHSPRVKETHSLQTRFPTVTVPSMDDNCYLPENYTVTIHKGEDEYFRVIIHSDQRPLSYIADQIDGLIKLLEHLFKERNIVSWKDIRNGII